jgi:hypothetical protein
MVNGKNCHSSRVVQDAILHYGSTGYPASIHACIPPRMGVTCVYPFCKRMSAARALVCSFCQVQ